MFEHYTDSAVHILELEGGGGVRKEGMWGGNA